MPPATPLPNPFYYLDNFEFVLDWLRARYPDLLSPVEHGFMREFDCLPRPSRALLVRMVMRKGRLFRADRLAYPEIGDPVAASAPLISAGWVEHDPAVRIDELFGLYTRAELTPAFGAQLASAGLARAAKQAQMDHLLSRCPETQPVSLWFGAERESPAYRLQITDLCDRYRLMFFGNLRQDWTEFVLAELGLYVYEQVDFPPSSRAFQLRTDIDDYLGLHRCTELLETDAEDDAVNEAMAAIPASPFQNPWLESRRARLLFRAGRHHERRHQWDAAASCYERSSHAEARARHVRVLERQARFKDATRLALDALAAPADEAETQQLQRMLPRLLRHCGMPPDQPAARLEVERLDLTLAQGPCPSRVEAEVLRHLWQDDAPVFYVENSLVNGLFGLLCWEAVFAPVPAAFFHPFQAAPADLLRPGFHVRRKALFDACFSQLDDGRYRDTIRKNFRDKAGVQCSFLNWQALDEALMELALACIPPEHLSRLFARLLVDIRSNRSGLPDLIQFWPAEQRYRMIEVKGPGDRLQDNQRRWIAYCREHGIPVSVCHVRRPAS